MEGILIKTEKGWVRVKPTTFEEGDWFMPMSGTNLPRQATAQDTDVIFNKESALNKVLGREKLLNYYPKVIGATYELIGVPLITV